MKNETYRPRIVICINAAWNIYNFRASLIRALQQDGFEVIAVAPSDAFVERLRSLQCAYYPMKMDNKGTSPLADAILFIRMLVILARLRPSAYLGWTIKPNIYGTLAARILRIPALNNVSGLGTTFIKQGWITRVVTQLYRAAFAGSAQIFFQNEDDRTAFISRGIVRAARTTVIPGSGVDIVHFAPHQRTARAGCIFLLVARMLRDKGVMEFVEAARLVRKSNPEACFKLVGMLDVVNRTAIARSDIEGWVSEGVVEYVGALDDVRQAIADSDCVVLPSYREGAPRSLIEAAAMGRATIATDVPGCRHVVEDGKTGLLCRVRDVGDLADAMRQMLTKGEEGRDAMGRVGRAMVEARFDDRIVIERYREALAAAGVHATEAA